MHRRSFLGLGLGLAGATSILQESTVAAAPAAAGKAEKIVDFKKHEVAAQKAPDFTLKGGATEKRFKAKEWIEIEFEIEINAPKAAPRDTKFLDNIEISFYIFLQPADATKVKVLKADVTYINVPVGNDKQHVVVYLSPSTLLNLTGDKIVDKNMIKYLGAEAKYNGALAGIFVQGAGTPAAPWWKAATAPPAEDGRLLPKHKTPFAPLWYDYYLEEKADK
jgi:hypothetical protein